MTRKGRIYLVLLWIAPILFADSPSAQAYRTFQVLDAPPGAAIQVAGVDVATGEPVTAPTDNVIVQVTLADGRVLEQAVRLSPDRDVVVRVVPRRPDALQTFIVFGVPGLAQFNDEQRAKGAAIWGGLAAGALMAIGGSQAFDAALGEYEEAIELYDRSRTPSVSGGGLTGGEQVAVAARADAEQAYSQMEQARVLHGAGLGVLIGIYGAAVLDGMRNHLGGLALRVEESPRVAWAPMYTDGPGLRLAIRF